MSGRLVALFITAAVILGGCKPGFHKPLPICAGKGSAAESLLAMGSQARKVAPLRATGSCRLEYYVEDKRKSEKEAFPIRLWMNPPAEISLHGDVAFDPRGVILGANKDEFWLGIRPKISSYWRGQWSDGNDVHTPVLSPKIVLEAVGIVSVESDVPGRGDWTLSNDGSFDVLTRRSADGVAIKKIYVRSCDYLVRKIEYFDEFGQVAVVAELEDYKEVAEGFFVPTCINVVKRGFRDRDDSVRIKLKSVKPMEFNPKQLDALFLPKPGRYEHVYEIIDGKWGEQPQ
jgi:hypothetical protein